YDNYVERIVSVLHSDDPPDGGPWPASEELERGWAAIALAIMERGGGVSAHPAELQAVLALADERLRERVGEWIRAGCACGLLTRDPSAGVGVRFVHHRMQEHFAGRAVAVSDEQRDWSALLDLPRWQGVLIQAAARNPGMPAVDALVDSLAPYGPSSDDS